VDAFGNVHQTNTSISAITVIAGKAQIAASVSTTLTMNLDGSRAVTTSTADNVYNSATGIITTSTETRDTHTATL
jgi:hypothetical protein